MLDAVKPRSPLTASNLSPRALRRHVRAPCKIRVGDAEAVALAANVSTTGVFVRTVAGDAEQWTAGRGVELSLQIPDHAAVVQAEAEIVWVDRSPVDGAIGLGLRLVRCSAEALSRLERFVGDFRYTVLAVHNDAQLSRVLFDTVASVYRLLECPRDKDALAIVMHEEVAAVIVDEASCEVEAGGLLARLDAEGAHAALSRIVLGGSAPSPDVEGLYHLPKGAATTQLLPCVRRAVERYALGVENARLSAEVDRAYQRLSGAASAGNAHAADGQKGLIELVDDYERQLLTAALARFGGNRTKTAQALKVPRQTLQDHLKRLKIG